MKYRQHSLRLNPMSPEISSRLTDLRAAMKLGPDSVVFLINTEGDTDPENYQNVLREADARP